MLRTVAAQDGLKIQNTPHNSLETMSKGTNLMSNKQETYLETVPPECSRFGGNSSVTEKQFNYNSRSILNQLKPNYYYSVIPLPTWLKSLLEWRLNI